MRIPITILLLAASAFAIEPAKPAAKDSEPPCCRVALDLGKPTDKSLYLLDSTWTSDVDRQIKLGKDSSLMPSSLLVELVSNT